jgi:hypothetical protein
VDEKLHSDIDEPILMMTPATMIAKPTPSMVTSRAHANRRFASHQPRSARRCAYEEILHQIADCGGG